MIEIKTIMKAQIAHFGLILRLAHYDERATYQNHYLGLFWQFLNPLIQVGLYYLIFGLGFYNGKKVAGVAFIIWLLIGLTCWLYMNATILGATTSIVRQLPFVSKLNFPVSILPTVILIGRLINFGAMLGLTVLIMVSQGIYPTVMWLQLGYYFVCMLSFLFSLNLLSATITVLIRDYQIALQSVMRVLFYLSGVVWDLNSTYFPAWLKRIFTLNPLTYIIEGFRNSLLSRHWFWQDGQQMVFFWTFVMLLLLIGTQLYFKFRPRFMDLI
ncbi:ABC transporter permease [Agrilactobacillus yilanensis]|uniref:Transport permease protein n=1 Tax=Agrilactobacillus yilanensis TaxID=2485997 RepID=A0ABW4J554_9LACO|nr:ABC transporter permease [Agrilactobacillus yilanensis]